MNRYAAAVALGTLVAAVSAASCKGCQKEEDVPPMPSATATPTQAPPMELTLEEDAAVEADADDGDAKKSGGPGVTRLVACCRALAQNAKSQANPLQAGVMLQAAAACESAARQGNLAAVNAALATSGMKCN